MPERRRRLLLKAIPGALLAFELRLAFGATVVAVRVWPADAYTRVTLELDEALKSAHFLVPDPPRLVVDLEGVALDGRLRDLVAKVRPNDPYIKAVRIGQNRPKVVRMVFDLKEPVVPQVFSVPPIARYRHRLVLDLHPNVPADPLADLIAQSRQTALATSPTKRPADPAAGAGATADAGEAPRASAARRRAGPASATDPAPLAAAPAGGATASVPASRGATARTAKEPVDPLASLIPPSDPPGAVGPAIRPAGPTAGESRGSPRRREPAVARMVTVAIDPGHGGEDPGAVGSGGTLEKDVVLAVARTLHARINAEPNMRAYLTRDSDYFVPLATRVAKARAVQADLLVSIHADAFVMPNARGSSVFVLSERGASSVGARWLANRENRADLIGGVDLSRNREAAKVLLDLSTTAQISESRRLAGAVLEQLRGVGNVHKAQVEQAGFAVLRAPDIPSILVETAFISNPEEERKLRDPRYRNRVAEAIFAGIRNHFSRNPPGPKGRAA